MTDIPDWAGKRACELLNEEFGYKFHVWPDSAQNIAVRTVAKLVMQHEQPPADPDEEAVKRIFAAWWPVGKSEKIQTNYPEAFARAVAQYKQERGNG